MFFAKIQDGVATEYPLKEEYVRKCLDNVSLPPVLTNEILEPFGYAVIEKGIVGEVPQATKYMSAIIGDVFKDTDGKWKRSYELSPIPEEFYQIRLDSHWKKVREKRAAKMDAFQWRIDRYNREVALGITPKDDIDVLHNYMQSLADITLQGDDPFLIVFPDEPL